MQEELELLRKSLEIEKQNLVEVTSERDKIRSFYDEKDMALQVI